MLARNRKNGRRGTSLVDAVVSLGVLVVSAGGLGMSVIYTQKSSTEMKRRDMIRSQAFRYVERFLGLAYGTDTDAAPTAAQVQDIFDDNGGVPVGVTLMGLRTPVNGEGWRFRVAGFEVPGIWEIEVNADLDGNGTLTGVRGTDTPTTGGTETAGDGSSTVTMFSESRTTLTRIEVFFNGISVAKTLRSAPVQGT